MPGIYVKNYPTCRLYLMAVQSYTPPTMPTTNTTTTVPGGQGQAPPTNSNITHGGLAMATRLPIKGQAPPHKKHRALPSKLYKCRVIRQDTRDAKAHIQFVTWMLSREDLMVVFGI